MSSEDKERYHTMAKEKDITERYHTMAKEKDITEGKSKKDVKHCKGISQKNRAAI